jgi:hypothetical protein
LEEWPAEDPAAAAYRGEAWLDQAMQELHRGRLPQFNLVTAEQMTFQFDVSSPDRTWHVELFDYSGELVNARQAADPDAFAAQLQQHLILMDGLLVLVAAPHIDSSLDRDHKDLQLLKEAFTALRAEVTNEPVFTKPVALLINKWDRQAGDLKGPPDSELSRLEAFLRDDKHAAWQGVAQAIQNSVASECFEMFPVSWTAFRRVRTCWHALRRWKWGSTLAIWKPWRCGTSPQALRTTLSDPAARAA